MRWPNAGGYDDLEGVSRDAFGRSDAYGESGNVRASASTSCTDATSTLRRKSIAQGRRGPCRGRAREEKLCAIGAFGAQVSQSEMIALDPPDHCSHNGDHCDMPRLRGTSICQRPATTSLLPHCPPPTPAHHPTSGYAPMTVCVNYHLDTH